MKKRIEKEMDVWFEVQKIFNCLTDARHNFHFLKIDILYVWMFSNGSNWYLCVCMLKIQNNVTIIISISTSWYLRKWHEMLLHRKKNPKIGCWWFMPAYRGRAREYIQIYFMSVGVSACKSVYECEYFVEHRVKKKSKLSVIEAVRYSL